MNPHIHQLKKARKVTLSKQTKSSIRATLLTHMQAHPVRETSSERLLSRNAFSFLSHLLTVRSPLFMPIFILSLVAMLGGGTAFAAHGALPGDFLYPVKVHVNEEIQSALTFSQQAKANLELTHAEERVKEAIRIEAKGELEETKKEQIEDQIARHSTRISEIAKQLEDQGNKQAAQVVRGHLEDYLDTKARLLSKIGMPIAGEDSDEDSGKEVKSQSNPSATVQTSPSPRREEIQNEIKSIKTENEELLLKLKSELNAQKDTHEIEDESDDLDEERDEDFDEEDRDDDETPKLKIEATR